MMPAEDVCICALIAAGGKGRRFNNPHGKQLVNLGGMPLFCWSVAVFDKLSSVKAIGIIASPEHISEMKTALDKYLQLSTTIFFAPAGATRQESVESGLELVPDECDMVAVHDGARPFIEPFIMENLLDEMCADPLLQGAIAAYPSVDTLKCVDGGLIRRTPDRSRFWCAQTPQLFWTKTLKEAYERAHKDGFFATDDASCVERYFSPVRCVESPHTNIKITTPEDLLLAEALAAQKHLKRGTGGYRSKEGEIA